MAEAKQVENPELRIDTAKANTYRCLNIECKKKLIVKGKDVTITQCLEVLLQSEAVDVTMKNFGIEHGNAKVHGRSTSYFASDPTRCSQKNDVKKITKQDHLVNLTRNCVYVAEIRGSIQPGIPSVVSIKEWPL